MRFEDEQRVTKWNMEGHLESKKAKIGQEKLEYLWDKINYG